MADEFSEHDLDTPSAEELDAAYSSRFLGVVDIGTKKIKTKISKVRMEEIKDRNSGRPRKRAVVFFEGVDKPLILNGVNRETLNDALGKAPAGWLGAAVGVLVDPNVVFGGKKTGGVRLRVLLPPAAAKPAKAKPATKAPAAAASEWPEEKGDPGADPGQADFEPAE